ncbi:3-phosphoshikimate 1-carboxyvinyltransferase [Fluviicola chungangensis]|uniref:3-phosphoshikimate 1-carboxyvinyltransferase n=1 Tax=Fluviicola chungangensis TaxID=2597671 RepID=A0A556N1C4_9FLAO|nr:3-phosphoshikimate 1-carboxyvinyltransferase [Fluviicola chungangensis]TSJ45829.1 3-phosphoshikimate 1-carboxyvinyltransferase [Fluviicola chungangensis]
MKQLIRPKVLSGNIAVPASKSDAQRAVLCAALAEGTSRLTGMGKSDDEQAMLRAVEQMGAEIVPISDTIIEITGIKSLPEGLHLSAGESGLGLRLLTCVTSGFNREVSLTGRGSLLARPMNFFDTVLPRFGVQVSTNNGFLPIKVHGPLQGTDLQVDGSLSSQFISGLLMALPGSRKASSLEVIDMKSGPYIQMTIHTLSQFGIVIENEHNRFTIPGKQQYRPAHYSIESDWSSASYWLVAAAIGHPVSVSGLTMRSLQADKSLLKALIAAGCRIVAEEDLIRVDGSGLRAFEFDATDCPDLFPALTILAAKCDGVSTIRGVNRLIHKESNRGIALQTEFGKMGLKIDLNDDLMVIYGSGKLHGTEVDSHHDHRIAMSLGIAGSIANGDTILTNADAVSKSYPDFWEHFNSL